jgi:hypothetical protein
MKKVVLVYGVLSGLIMWVFGGIVHSQGFEGSMVFGFVLMIASLAVIFPGIKSYRDQHLGGVITFGQGFKVGILIALIASVFYIVGWEIYMQNNMPNFMADYMAKQLEAMKAAGASAAEIAEFQAESVVWVERYKNPLIRYVMTFTEFIPVGLIISLLAAWVMKKPTLKPAVA